jgi:hypothetical protein
VRTSSKRAASRSCTTSRVICSRASHSTCFSLLLCRRTSRHPTASSGAHAATTRGRKPAAGAPGLGSAHQPQCWLDAKRTRCAGGLPTCPPHNSASVVQQDHCCAMQRLFAKHWPQHDSAGVSSCRLGSVHATVPCMCTTAWKRGPPSIPVEFPSRRKPPQSCAR